MIHLSSGRTLVAVATLHQGGCDSALAARLLPLLGDQEDTVADCLREAVGLEAARHLWELGQEEPALHYCLALGEKGKELRLELSQARPSAQLAV
jgi:hypothetical protein